MEAYGKLQTEGRFHEAGDVAHSRPKTCGHRQEPAGAETAAAMEKMKDMGVLMGKGGLHGNCFRIKCAPRLRLALFATAA